MLKQRSISFEIILPNNFSKAAKRKNLNPRPIKAKRINKKIFKPNNPLAIVINLNGKGVKLAPNTIKQLYSLKFDSNLEYFTQF